MLSAIKKGLIVGLANLVVVAFLIGLDEGVRHLTAVLMIITVIGAAPALAIGALCGWIGGRLPVFRRLVLVWVPMTAVIVLGVISEPALIGPAVLPTMLGSLLLERWTRPNLGVQQPGLELSPPVQGMVIGAANVVVVAILLAVYVTRIEPRQMIAGISIHPPFGLHFAALVACVGVVPGVVVGGLAGFLAQRLRECSLPTRLAGIGSVAISGVLALASLAGVPELVMPALLPTLFAVGVLERTSRSAEIVPAARVVAHVK